MIKQGQIQGQVQTLTSRKQKLNSIRESFKKINVFTINREIVEEKLRLKEKNKRNQSTMTESSQEECNNESLNNVETFQKKYRLLQKVGEGTDGVVYKCVKKRTGKVMAVKCFKVEDDHLTQLKENFRILKMLKRPNILRHEALYIDMKRHQGWLVMELISHPTLDEVKLTKEEDLRFVMLQLCDAIAYLHHHELVHRDIKPENILIDPLTKKIKLIDFGICKPFRSRGSLCDLWTPTGTIYYEAPQMLGGGYRQGVDVWAAGISLFQMVCGYTPFESEYLIQTKENILGGQLVFPEMFKNYSNEIINLIGLMLTRKTSQRPSMTVLLKNRWFSLSNFSHESYFFQLQDYISHGRSIEPLTSLSTNKRRKGLQKSIQSSQKCLISVHHLHSIDSEAQEEFSSEL